MRMLTRAIVIAVFAAGAIGLASLATASLRAQGQTQDHNHDHAAPPASPGPSDADDDAKPFVPPAASRSVEIANYYFRKKMYSAALSRYQEATQTDSYYALSYLGLGRTYEKIGLKQKALDAYQKYLDLLPSEKQADEAKRVHEAMARLERQLKKSGAHATASRRQSIPAQ